MTLRLSTALLFIMLSRQQGAEESGTFALAMTFILLFSQIAYWGMDQVLTREVAHNHALASQYLGNFILIRLALSLTLYGVLLILVQVGLKYPPYTAGVVLIASITIVFDGVNNLCQALYAAFEVIRYQAVTKFFVGGLQVVGGSLVLWNGGGALGLAVVVTTANLVALGVNLFIVYRRFPRPSWEFKWHHWIPQLGSMLPFVFIGVFFTIEYQVDTLILAQIQGTDAVGIYTAATAILYGLLLLPQAYRTAVFPVLSRLYLTQREKFVWAYQKSFKYLLLIAMPLALTISLIAYPLIQMLYTSDFVDAAPVLQILLIVFVINTANVPGARALIVANRQRWVAPLQGGSMVLNIVLNLWLVPSLGVMGSAWARVGSSIAYFVVTLILAQRRIVPCRLTNGVWQIALASIALTLTTLGLNALGWWWGLSACAGLAAYSAILVLVHGISADEYAILREVWTHQRGRIAILR